MKTLALSINVLGFAALFLAYAAGASVERPSGVRRALQTYAGQLPNRLERRIGAGRELGVSVSANV
jgi:hypothetical protein